MNEDYKNDMMQPEEPEADLPDGPFGEQEAEDPAGK